jgi:hypothetical protein
MEAKKSFAQVCCVLAALVLATYNATSAQVADVILTSKSIAGYGSVKFDRRALFTTPDGTSELPLHTIGTNNNLRISRELRPDTNQPALYRTDIMIIPAAADPANVQSNHVLAFGPMTLLFPTNDVDTNGILDFLQIDRSMDGLVLGTAVNEMGASALTLYPEFDGFVTGGASLQAAAFEFNVINDDTQNVGFDTEGQFELLHIGGTVKKLGPILKFQLSSTNDFGGFTYKGNTAGRIKKGELRLSPFVLKRSDGAKIKVPKTILRQVNGEWVGELVFNDWNQETPWPDYQRWGIEIGEFVRQSRR